MLKKKPVKLAKKKFHPTRPQPAKKKAAKTQPKKVVRYFPKKTVKPVVRAKHNPAAKAPPYVKVAPPSVATLDKLFDKARSADSLRK